MDFGLSQEQELLQETVRGFVEKECPPARLRALFDGQTGHDAALWSGLVEMGIAGLVVPEAHGGSGLELLEAALVSEQLGAGAVPSPFLGHALATLAIARGGSDAQRAAWLPALAAGDAIGSVAFAEEGGLWQPEEWTLAPEGGRLRGAKSFVSHAALADVFAVGLAGGGLALVERNGPGVSTSTLDTVDRTRRLGRLVFDAAPCEVLEDGVRAAPAVRDAALVLCAADSLGAAWQLVRATVDYTLAREQFETRLAQFQAVKHALADMATDLEPGRALLWYAAHALDHLPDEAARAAALAKAHVTDRALAAARSAIELHGGIGFTWECDVQIYYKRALANRALFGTPEVHRERNAALAGWGGARGGVA